ncbi:hypothetical protein TSAR_015772 [Trichomalopsis sarcophagae]|uniref:Uncharacterized protein n=1 Tax=Trichomalopsis sarcophagae TaxID=543379 RepID=A0A232EQA4_9HYME|nr:hypothetical protein TSAR_015772 [Trichomalopsis sarcophagae]
MLLSRTNLLLLQRYMSKKSVDLEKPIEFSSSRAAQWKAEYTRSPPSDMVWFTPYVVSGSVAIFMLYFCVLREENDIDEMIYRPLPETLEGIEKVFPNVDFYTKPDYVTYHEDKEKERKAKLLR